MVRAGIQCTPLVHSLMVSLPNGAVHLSCSYMNNIDEIDYFCEKITKF